MSLALNDPEYVALHSNSNTTSEHATHVEIDYCFFMQNNQWKVIRDNS